MEKPFIASDSLFISRDKRRNRWAVPYHFDCLNSRIENLLENHRHTIQGKVILDIGSHMGTFSYAALKMGADFVHCIDTEESLVSQGAELFEYYKVPKTRYRFETVEAAHFLESQGENKFDTLLCLGLLYYTQEPFQLLRLMKQTARETILLDTFTAAYAAVQGKHAEFIRNYLNGGALNLPMMLVIPTESQKKDYHLPNSFSHDGKELSLTTYPTESLLETWFQILNLKYERLSWNPYIQGLKQWKDLVSTVQKKESHWADIYSSDLRISYHLNLY